MTKYLESLQDMPAKEQKLRIPADIVGRTAADSAREIALGRLGIVGREQTNFLGAATSVSEILRMSQPVSIVDQMKDYHFSRLGNFTIPNFVTPAASDLAKLGIAYPLGPFPRATSSLHNEWQGGIASRIFDSMGKVRHPWLDENNLKGSFSSFAEIQKIGASIQHLAPFNEPLTKYLRGELGDWRAPIQKNLSTLIDPISRAELYVERGLNIGLTDFPEESFVEGTELAGLRSEIDTEPTDLIVDDTEDEESLKRINRAHDAITRLELALRKFIHRKMEAQCGHKWVKQRVPGAMWQDWEVKREIALSNDELERPIIFYADFTDYATVITKNDNWNEIFKPVFKRPENIRESFQRLYPIRICTMHARPITLDDEMLLMVETKRIHKAINKS